MVEQRTISAIQDELARIWLGDNARHASALQGRGLEPANRSMTALDLARRPHVTLDAVLGAMVDLGFYANAIPAGITLERAQTAIAYSSFIDKEEREAERHRKAASDRLDPNLDYATVRGLRVEAQQRLNATKPLNIGQAQRTPGVTPGDISALLVHLSRNSAGHVQYGPYGE